MAESDVVTKVTESIQANGIAQTNGAKENGANGTHNASKSSKVDVPAPKSFAAAAALPPPAPEKDVSSSTTSDKPKPASSPLPSVARLAEPIPTPQSPPQSAFKPQLPRDLPGPSSTALSADRKRKTPQDFTPAGPRDTQTASSPSKISVKFEDGLAPGEGADGEKTIPPVKSAVAAVVPRKNQNMVERTVWTFIMIAGFVSKCIPPRIEEW